MAEKEISQMEENLSGKKEEDNINPPNTTNTTTINSNSNTLNNIRVTDMLRSAYDEKNFVLLDEIVQDMVAKSYVDGLKKLHTACGYGFFELVEQYLKTEKMDPNSKSISNIRYLNLICASYFDLIG